MADLLVAPDREIPEELDSICWSPADEARPGADPDCAGRSEPAQRTPSASQLEPASTSSAAVSATRSSSSSRTGSWIARRKRSLAARVGAPASGAQVDPVSSSWSSRSSATACPRMSMNEVRGSVLVGCGDAASPSPFPALEPLPPELLEHVALVLVVRKGERRERLPTRSSSSSEPLEVDRRADHVLNPVEPSPQPVVRPPGPLQEAAEVAGLHPGELGLRRTCAVPERVADPGAHEHELERERHPRVIDVPGMPDDLEAEQVVDARHEVGPDLAEELPSSSSKPPSARPDPRPDPRTRGGHARARRALSGSCSNRCCSACLPPPNVPHEIARRSPRLRHDHRHRGLPGR